MTEHDAYDQLTRILRDVFERDDIVATPTLTARDIVGWDSFKQVEILLAIEETLGVTFRPSDVHGLGNVGDLARIMLPHTAVAA